MSNESVSNTKPTGVHTLKFVLISIIGIFLFMVPINLTQLFGWELARGDRANIILGHLIDIIQHDLFNNVVIADFPLHFILALILITVSMIGTLVAVIAKPKWIMENKLLKDVFYTTPLYIVTKIVGCILIWMIILGVESEVAVIAMFMGEGGVIAGLVATLVIIFLALLPFMPLITDFGLMDFIGISIRKVVRALFTLPGRASVDLMASWFGSSVVSIIITRGQHERGFYTGREAAVIAVNFSFVSLPFTYVVADMMGLELYFLWFYLVMCLTCVILGFFLPRIWPQKQLPDTYLEEVGKQSLEDEKPENMSNFSYAVEIASTKAKNTKFSEIGKSAGRGLLGIYMDLLPIVMAWGTIAAVVAMETPIVRWLSWPFGQFMRLLQIEYAMEAAPLTLVGFIDMLLPAILADETWPIMTLFVIGVLSIVQIIYIAETGVLIIKSKMPLGIGKLAIIFLMRTILGLPIIVGLTHLFRLIPAFPF
jgi:nucleoside recognition membrane protein YjiH